MPTVSFRQGANGYTGASDTYLQQSEPTAGNGARAKLSMDGDTPTGTGQDEQALLQFANIFGTGPGQVPLGATITGATLTFNTTNAGDGATLHRMLAPWTSGSTWSSLGNGIQTDGAEAVAAADADTGSVALGSRDFDVTASLQAWSDGGANNGWALLPKGADGWIVDSAERGVATAPLLTVTYTTGGGTPPPPPGPSLAVSGSPSLPEGNSGATAFAFTVTRSGDTAVASSAAWAVAGSGTNAAAAADFAGGALPMGTVSFAAGETSKTITVNVAGDTTVEPDETFTLTLSNPSSGTTIATATSTGTIQNDDTATPGPSLAVSGSPSLPEGNSGATTAFAFTVTRSGDTAVASSAAWAVAGSGTNAATAADFAGGAFPSGTVNFATGETSKTITVNVAGDTAVEPDETFTLTLSNPSSGTTIATATSTGTIQNDDTATEGGQTVSFRQGANGYTGASDTYLQQSEPTAGNGARAKLSMDGDTPTGTGQDEQALLQFANIFGTGPGQVPLGATITGATLTFNTTNAGDGATLHRMLAPWTSGSTWSSLGNGIQTDGAEAVAAADADTGSVALGSRDFDVTASLQAWSDGGANNGWALLPKGADGWIVDSAERGVATAPLLTVTYTTGGGTPPPPPGPSLAVSGSPSLPEGNSGATAFAFTVTRSGDTAVASSAAWAVAGSGTNAAAAADFAGGALPMGTVSFAAGETSKTITVNVAGDTTVEPDETFTLTLSNPSSGTTIATATSTGTIQNDDTATEDRPFAESYIAKTYIGGRQRNLEHDNAAKAFFTNGDWYGVIPDGPKWGVERFDGPVPAAGQQGGWTRVSTDTFKDTNRASDIAWDEVTDTLYVLQYWDASNVQPTMYRLSHDSATRTFSQQAEVTIAGSGGKLPSSHWIGTPELVIGMDQFGTPLVADVGEATTGANRGVHLAWASKDLSTWGEATIDPVPTAAGGNSKADIVSFTKDGVDYVGIAYSADDPATSGVTGDVWKFASHRTSSNPADYATGWTIETFNNTVAIDNHISAVWSGSEIFVAMKDDQDRVWMTKGLPGDWDPAVQVARAGPSRPTLMVDEADNTVLVFYQQRTGTLYGDIYMKSVSQDGPLGFDPTTLGTPVMRTNNGTSLSDPQLIVHPVDASMDGMFPTFAANQENKEIWYNKVDLGSAELLA